MILGIFVIFGLPLIISAVFLWWVAKLAVHLAWALLKLIYLLILWVYYRARVKPDGLRANRRAGRKGKATDTPALPPPAAVPQQYSREFWRSWVSPEPRVPDESLGDRPAKDGGA